MRLLSKKKDSFLKQISYFIKATTVFMQKIVKMNLSNQNKLHQWLLELIIIIIKELNKLKRNI